MVIKAHVLRLKRNQESHVAHVTMNLIEIGMTTKFINPPRVGPIFVRKMIIRQRMSKNGV